MVPEVDISKFNFYAVTKTSTLRWSRFWSTKSQAFKRAKAIDIVIEDITDDLKKQMKAKVVDDPT